ncbi:MAG: phosphoglycerate dehydrogenase [Nitrospirota bacterium]|nr:MAG: phosphoglycerate dehydrogenase [Nitrospirota bacterium]
MKVLISDNLSQNGIDILKNAGLEVDVKTGMKPDELKECIGEYHGIVIRSATKMTEDIIEAADNLKVIGRAGSGLDNVDKNAASKKGVVVMNTPGGNTITTAEHAFSMILSLARNIPQATASMKANKWEKKKFIGVELFNKTLGIVGIGAIGSQVARMAQGLEMNVLAFDPFLSSEKAADMGVEKVELDELFKRADVITIHTPLTNETKYIVNKETIGTMKHGVRIVNCARGGIINEKDLAEAIISGKVAGAALDVFETEPPEGNPLVGMDQVICTPHLGASTTEAQENVAIKVAEQIVDYLVSGTIRNAVNFPSIPADQLPRLQPYITLAEKMGTVATQLYGGSITEINMEFKGEATDINSEPVTIAAITGLLNPILEEAVNFVNAPFIAKERGIEIKETRSDEASDYHSLLVLRITYDGKEGVITGTLVSRKEPRIIKVDNFPVEIVPEGILLYIQNNDMPGVVGNIGMTLGKNNINIARMHFGRESKGGNAISVVNIDSDVNDDVLKQIKALPNINSVKVIKL